MSVYSTMQIERSDAMTEIRNALSDISNRQIADVLFALFGEKIRYSFWVVDEYEEQDEWGYPTQYANGCFDVDNGYVFL
ncbi:MAG: hypothetical protein GY861_22345 [bacterium]|nr:hypothetical protein [bacterium]